MYKHNSQKMCCQTYNNNLNSTLSATQTELQRGITASATAITVAYTAADVAVASWAAAAISSNFSKIFDSCSVHVCDANACEYLTSKVWLMWVNTTLSNKTVQLMGESPSNTRIPPVHTSLGPNALKVVLKGDHLTRKPPTFPDEPVNTGCPNIYKHTHTHTQIQSSELKIVWAYKPLKKQIKSAFCPTLSVSIV